MTQTAAPHPSTAAENSRASMLRIVGVVAIVGTLAHITAGVLHGALTAGTDRSSSVTVYAHVLATPAWGAINLGLLLATLAWLAVFVGVERATPSDPTWRAWLGRLATVVLTFGVAAAALLFLTDAIVLPTLAEQWATAAPERQAELVVLGDTVQTVIRIPLFHVLPLFVFGLPFALIGAAHTDRASLLPRWLAWLTLTAGTTSFVMGLTWALGSTAIPEVILWALIQPFIWTWGIATGISLWRRSRQSPCPRTGGPTEAAR